MISNHVPPLVSIIIPVKNSDKYLPQCISSIIKQTLKNIEIIIIDDASTDMSGYIADSYAEQDNRIKVIHNYISTGAGKARNLGLKNSQGLYICFIDSDDFYPDNNILEILYNEARRERANICGGSLIKVNKQGDMLDTQNKSQFFEEKRWYTFQEYQYEGGFTRFIYEHKFLKYNQLLFPDLQRFEDPIFHVKAMLASQKFYAIPKITYAYRKINKYHLWGSREAHDHIKGVIELLIFSRTACLTKLHYAMAKNFLDSLIIRMHPLGICETIYLTIRALYNIDWEFIFLENKNNSIKITFYKFIYMLSKNILKKLINI